MNMRNGLMRRVEALEAHQGTEGPAEGVLARAIAAMAMEELRASLSPDEFSLFLTDVFEEHEPGDLPAVAAAKLEEWVAVFEQCLPSLTTAQVRALAKGYFAPAKKEHEAAKAALAVVIQEHVLFVPGFLTAHA